MMKVAGTEGEREDREAINFMAATRELAEADKELKLSREIILRVGT